MRVYFKQINHLSYSESGNLYMWGRERKTVKNGGKQVYFTKQKSRSALVGDGNGLGPEGCPGPPSPSPPFTP